MSYEPDKGMGEQRKLLLASSKTLGLLTYTLSTLRDLTMILKAECFNVQTLAYGLCCRLAHWA